MVFTSWNPQQGLGWLLELEMISSIPTPSQRGLSQYNLLIEFCIWLSLSLIAKVEQVDENHKRQHVCSTSPEFCSYYISNRGGSRINALPNSVMVSTPSNQRAKSLPGIILLMPGLSKWEPNWAKEGFGPVVWVPYKDNFLIFHISYIYPKLLQFPHHFIPWYPCPFLWGFCWRRSCDCRSSSAASWCTGRKLGRDLEFMDTCQGQ